jgi:hypothetical protein
MMSTGLDLVVVDGDLEENLCYLGDSEGWVNLHHILCGEMWLFVDVFLVLTELTMVTGNIDEVIPIKEIFYVNSCFQRVINSVNLIEECIFRHNIDHTAQSISYLKSLFKLR